MNQDKPKPGLTDSPLRMALLLFAILGAVLGVALIVAYVAFGFLLDGIADTFELWRPRPLKDIAFP